MVRCWLVSQDRLGLAFDDFWVSSGTLFSFPIWFPFVACGMIPGWICLCFWFFLYFLCFEALGR